MYVFRGRWYHGDVFYDATQFWTIEEASEATGYHPDHLRRLLRNGELDGQKIVRVWLVNRQSLMEYINQGKASGDERRGPK